MTMKIFTCKNMEKSNKHNDEQKKSETKEHILYDFI